MVDSEKKQFGFAIAALLETSGQESTNARLHGYWLGLRDLELGQVENAVAVAIRTIKGRTASPAELREIASGGSVEHRAIAAWSNVLNAASVSYMHDLDFADRVINAVVRSLGGRWSFFERLNSGTESEKWLRIEFLKTYQVVVSRGVGDEAIKVLVGQADHEPINGRSGQVQIATISSDPERAKLSPPRNTERIRHNAKVIPKVTFQKIPTA